MNVRWPIVNLNIKCNKSLNSLAPRFLVVLKGEGLALIDHESLIAK
jgi:hypothetical protein